MERHDPILDLVPDIIARVDKDKRYVWLNAAGLEFFGPDAIGRPASDFFVGEQETVTRVEPLFKGDEGVFYIESWQRRKDGEKRLLTWWCRSEKDADGGVVGAVSVARDATAHFELGRQVLAGQAQLADALALAHLGTWEFDALTGVFTFNDAFYAIYHTTAAAVGGYTLPAAEYAKRFVHPDDAPMVGEEVRKSNETTDPDYTRTLEHRILYADGGVGHIAVRFRVVKDDQGRTVKTFGINQDITEMKQKEESLQRMAEDLARKNDELVRMNGLMTDRELRMIELKKRIEELESANSKS